MRINIEDYFEEATDGQFLINGKWYTPLFGCDTIQHLLDDLNSQLEARVINFGADYNGDLLKAGDRVRSVYAQYEPNNIGTITKDGCIIYDDEPETEYQILDSRYLIKI